MKKLRRRLAMRVMRHYMPRTIVYGMHLTGADGTPAIDIREGGTIIMRPAQMRNSEVRVQITIDGIYIVGS